MKVSVVLTPGPSAASSNFSGKNDLEDRSQDAINEALQLKQSGGASEVIVVTLGQALTHAQNQKLFQQGIDYSRFVSCDFVPSPMELAEMLVDVVQLEVPDLILIGRGEGVLQCQLGTLLAELLEFRSSQLEQGSQYSRTLVIREIGSGMQIVSLPVIPWNNKGNEEGIKQMSSCLQVA